MSFICSGSTNSSLSEDHLEDHNVPWYSDSQPEQTHTFTRINSSLQFFPKEMITIGLQTEEFFDCPVSVRVPALKHGQQDRNIEPRYLEANLCLWQKISVNLNPFVLCIFELLNAYNYPKVTEAIGLMQLYIY